jgi:hypothetical protein
MIRGHSKMREPLTFGIRSVQNAFLMAGIGDRLGLFAVLAANEAQSSAELADRTGLQERYLREWLAPAWLPPVS